METFYEDLTTLVSQWDIAFTRKSELEEMLEKNPKPTKPEIIRNQEEYDAFSSATIKWSDTLSSTSEETSLLNQKLDSLEFDIKSVFKVEDLYIWFRVKSASGNLWGVKVKMSGSGISRRYASIKPWKEVEEEIEMHKLALENDD